MKTSTKSIRKNKQMADLHATGVNEKKELQVL
jgi:hypothetical protein